MDSIVLPHGTVFKFYEGNIKSQYTPLTGVNLNDAPGKLLENDQALLAGLNEVRESAEDLSIVFAIALG